MRSSSSARCAPPRFAAEPLELVRLVLDGADRVVEHGVGQVVDERGAALDERAEDAAEQVEVLVERVRARHLVEASLDELLP
jgi:hypothetical protein